MKRVVVIGAGVGGLATAAILARAGLDVTVIEAHVYPGGCAATFPHRGYHFDAGATLAAGFYPGGPMHMLAEAAGIENWEAKPAETAICVHMPGGAVISLQGDETRWEQRREVFGPGAEAFWQWQEHTADALWDLALRLPPWPPQTPSQAVKLSRAGLGWLQSRLPGGLNPGFVADALRPVAAHLRQAGPRLRLFVDAQLLISAQATSQTANALYGAAALDLSRRGVVNLKGGMGSIAHRLVEAVQRHGGQVLFRQEATRIVVERSRPVAVETRRGRRFDAEVVVANLTPWNAARLLGKDAPPRLRKTAEHPADGWGAFVVYAGIDKACVPARFSLHHQVVVGEPLAEGNSVFLSLSPEWDLSRAPEGKRAVTISTHTKLAPWLQLFYNDRIAYEVQEAAYCRRLLSTAETALPGLSQAASLVLSGTPVTFEQFTRRRSGWVGGFPQTGLLRAWGPRLGPGLWMVGDSIFPGQSTAAVALGGMRVAQEIIEGWREK